MSRHASYSTTIEGLFPIDIRWLARQGWLYPRANLELTWRRSSLRVVLRDEREAVVYYRLTASGQDVQQAVDITRTPCTFGGSRPWWVCPRCGRRAAILYAWGTCVLCRLCVGAPYEVQRERPLFRMISRVQRLRRKIGGSANLSEPLPWHKPKGMHENTFQRHLADIRRAEQILWTTQAWPEERTP